MIFRSVLSQTVTRRPVTRREADRTLDRTVSIGWPFLRTLMLLVLVSGCGSQPRLSPLPTIPLAIRGQTLTVEVAADPVARDRGLMFRRHLEENSGMLFVFPRQEMIGFWMKNTYLPLSIAFLDTDGAILGITDMEPLDESMHFSPSPARYALEVPQGWFAAQRIVRGDRCQFRLPRGMTVR